MSKAYGHRYYHQGSNTSCGDLICSKCHKVIDNKTQDWKCAKKDDKYGNWRYILHHRNCTDDQSGWIKIEEKAKEESIIVNEITEFLAKYLERDGCFSDYFYAAMDKLGYEISRQRECLIGEYRGGMGLMYNL